MTKAPWTPDQVESLNAYQKSGVRHPFTCGAPGCGADLVASVHGWACPQCNLWTQDWCHGWMADWSWKKFDWRQTEFGESPS